MIGLMDPSLDDYFDPADGRPDEPTLCVDCDLVHPDTRDVKRPYMWRCMAHHAQPLGGFVDPNFRPDPPYLKCERVNDGKCPFWLPRRMPADV